MSWRKIIAFFCITYLWTWLFWTPFVLPYFDIEIPSIFYDLKTLIFVSGAFGPLVSAMILIYRDKGLKGIGAFFKKCLNIKIRPIYIILAFTIPLLLNAIFHYLPYVLNIDKLPNSYFPVDAGLPLALTLFIYVFVMFLIGGGQEEFGWRGYILEPLQEKIGLIKASLLIGIIWSLWHLPLWFMPSESHTYYSFFGFAIMATSFSVVLGIFHYISGKKMIIAWIFHSMSNFALSMFPVFFLEHRPQPMYNLWIGSYVVFSIITVLWYQKRYLLNSKEI